MGLDVAIRSEVPASLSEEAQPCRLSRRIPWPNGARFAFTIFDDPDGQRLEVTRTVYSFLASLGMRTTIAVWPLGVRRTINSRGETCANPEYVSLLKQLQREGFEIAYHNAAPHPCTREETLEAFDSFEQHFGA